jgi:phosphatidylserine/phosphatidylglycerophosphate/cardiolipin synthase-like enzyme
MGCRLAVALIVLSLGIAAVPAGQAPAPAATVDVLFSPEGGCEARILAELARARRSIRMQAYTFTSAVVTAALRDARGRGVDCEIILDKSNITDRFSEVSAAHRAGITCLIDHDHTVANNKVIIIDDATVITGSYNFTRAAERSNAENMLVIAGMPEVARAYVENYARHRQHARPYQPGAAGAAAAASTAPADNLAPRVSRKVYITTNGKRYHAAGCEFLRGTGRPIEIADIRGKYTPCSRCLPDE